MQKSLYFADLTHTAQGVSASTFPLGISYVVSYAQKQLGENYKYKLFKFLPDLEKAILETAPAVLAFSNYSWNFEFAYKIASLAKAKFPDLVIVFGGPNFPIVDEERQSFLLERPNIDFYIQLEGEIGFVDLIHRLEKHGFSAHKLKEAHESVLNTSYLEKGIVHTGKVERIHDINAIPSPYLTGILDEFYG